MMIDFDILWPKYGIKPDGVLHLGANTGQEAPVYAKHGVKEVVWIEAIPAVFNELVRNVDQYGHTCILACVGEDEGREVEFNISNNESQSSSYLELAHHKIIHPEVGYVGKIKTTIRRLDVVMAEEAYKEGVWYLNADLQGAELPSFKGMGNLLHDFKYVYTEVNKRETYKGCALIEEVDEYLGRFGFVRVETGQWVGDTWTDALYIKS